MVEIHVDGSGYNGKESKICVFINGKYFVEKYKERFTNNEMEYKAIIKGLEFAEDGDIIYSDSQLIVGQLKRGWKVNASHLLPLINEARRLLNLKPNIRLIWIGKYKNKAEIYFDRGRK